MSNKNETPSEKIEFRPRVFISKTAYDRFHAAMLEEVRKSEGDMISAILEKMFRGDAVADE